MTDSKDKRAAGAASVASHTPGPWRLGRTEEEWDDIDKEWRGSEAWIVGPGGVAVCDYAGCGSHDWKIGAGDARLIAAAPALADALEAILPYSGSLAAFAPDEHRAALDVVYAALRAAGRLP